MLGVRPPVASPAPQDPCPDTTAEKWRSAPRSASALASVTTNAPLLWTTAFVVFCRSVCSPLRSLEFIPLSFWYDAPLISRDRDRRHDPWLVYGSPSYSPAQWSSWISPAGRSPSFSSSSRLSRP